MKQKFKMYLCVGVGNWNEGQFTVSSYNPDNLDIKHRSDAMVKEFEIEVDVPEKVDIIALKLKALEESLAKDKAETFTRQNLLLDQISKLKCLTHDVVGE